MLWHEVGALYAGQWVDVSSVATGSYDHNTNHRHASIFEHLILRKAIVTYNPPQ